MNDLIRTQHYSTNILLLDGLLNFIQKNAKIIEPFYGKGDLVKNIDVSEYYDISLEDNHKRDTLLNPPDYKGKWVITNPPYLAKNKAKDKRYFSNNNYDDLYKIAISTMLAAEGGILVIPINFFSDARSSKIRKEFLSTFSVKRINYFKNRMFDNTSYNVCSFAFERSKETSYQEIPLVIYGDEIKTQKIILEEQYDYRLGGEIFEALSQKKILFSRITQNNEKTPIKINVMCIDKKNEPLHFYYSDTPYYGKDSDRNIATLSYIGEGVLTEEEQKRIIEEANRILGQIRERYFDIILTNFRDRNRKRISFQEAYQVASFSYWFLKRKREVDF